MPWKQVGMSEQRIEFAVEGRKPDANIAELCRAHGISRQTGYTWLRRYQQEGAMGVIGERSRRPHHSPKQAAGEVVEALRAAREARPDWGARKLAVVLRAEHPQLPVYTASTLQRILEREGLIENRDRQQIALERFERSQANELWQMDFKGPQGFNKGIGPLSIVDDHSRYVLALRQVAAATTGQVKSVLQSTFEQSGLPERLLLDHGKPWYDSMNAWGWTELTVWIRRQGVRISFSGVRHPQTQGKVERMHGALQRAWRKRKPTGDIQQWLDAFRHEYNHVRPHEGIGMATPATRWCPSSRAFTPDPGDWEYPSHWDVVRVAEHGHVRYRHRRWEVSRALRGQLVGLEVNGARVLVYYCNMAVRELQLETGANRPVPGNPFRMLAT